MTHQKQNATRIIQVMEPVPVEGRVQLRFPPLLRVTPLSSRAHSEYNMIATHFIDDWRPTHHNQQ